MTSQSRRNRPTTQLNSLRMNSRERRAEAREPEHRLPFRSLAVFALAACISVPATASDLRWRSERADAAERSSQGQNADASPPTSTSRATSTYSNSGNPLRFVRPQTATLHSDPAVRQTAFEDDAPQLTSGREADTRTRSVVVNRDDATDSVRSAQLPTSGAGTNSTAAPSAGNTNSQSTDRLRSPFGDLPTETPQLETPQFAAPTPPDSTNVPPPQNNTNPPKEQPPQPIEHQPVQSPRVEQPAAAPPAGQFQPVLPSGPTPPLPIETGPSAPLTPTATVEAERGIAKESCDKSLENLRSYTVDKVNLKISIAGTEGKDYPFECSIDDGQQFKGRCWEQTTYMWKASAMCHKPLYFEDEQLERYGHSFSPCFQPFVSGAHFFCTLPVLPYCMGVEPPCECIYALGYYRPGSCAPYVCNPIPISLRGALFEAGAVTGAAAALP